MLVRFEKRGLTTAEAISASRAALTSRERDAGVAGSKGSPGDRAPVGVPPDADPAARPRRLPVGVRVLEAARHGHKLRTGHVRANRFVLIIREVDADWRGSPRATDPREARRAARRTELLRRAAVRQVRRQRGEGPRAAARERGHCKLDRFFVSALQSELFNAWLVARMQDGLYTRVLTGDVLHKVGGGMFTSEDATVDERRLRAGESS